MLNIIFEDNHILVIEKPINIPSQADLSGDIDILSLCKTYLKKKYGKPGNVYCGLIHRLDRPVGGLMVFAKTSKAASRLSDSIRQKKMTKKYIAIVQGKLVSKESTLKHYLLKDKKKNITQVKNAPFSNAKESILHYTVLKETKTSSFVEIELITGRSHQIRSQFSFIGHPLFGDKKYGSLEQFKGIALYSSHLAFKHPTRDEILTFDLLPDWFSKTLQ